MNETSQNLHRTIETLVQTAQFDVLIDTCKVALADARSRSDGITEITSLIGLAQGHHYLGKFKEARVLIDGARRFSEQVGDRELLMRALLTAADMRLTASYQPYEARQDYREALQIAVAIDDQEAISAALCGVADSYLMLDDRTRARRHARQAFEIAQQHQYRYLMARALALVGVATTENQPELALQAFEDAMSIAQQDNFRLLELHLTADIGNLLSREDRYADEGQLMLEKALALAKDFCSVPDEFVLYSKLGRALESRQQFERAALYYSNMLERAQAWRARAYEGQAFFALGWLAYQRAHYDDAIANFEQALTIARETHNPFQEAQAEQIIGSSYFNMSAFEPALDHYMSARSLYDALDNRTMATAMLQRIVLVYVQRLFVRLMRWLGFDRSSDDA
ncbi:MAG: tetratricopeptide repeat protein [Anaerolineae bacterium]